MGQGFPETYETGLPYRRIISEESYHGEGVWETSLTVPQCPLPELSVFVCVALGTPTPLLDSRCLNSLSLRGPLSAFPLLPPAPLPVQK